MKILSVCIKQLKAATLTDVGTAYVQWGSFPVTFPCLTAEGYTYMVRNPRYKVENADILLFDVIIRPGTYQNWVLKFFKKDEYELSGEKEENLFKLIWAALANAIEKELEEKDEEPKLGKVNYADVKFIEHFLTFFELSDYYQPEYISQPIADNQKHDAISSEAATKLTFEEFVEQYFKMKR